MENATTKATTKTATKATTKERKQEHKGKTPKNQPRKKQQQKTHSTPLLQPHQVGHGVCKHPKADLVTGRAEASVEVQPGPARVDGPVHVEVDRRAVHPILLKSGEVPEQALTKIDPRA
jgi:hypothetical protein